MVSWRQSEEDFEKREKRKITFTPLFIECVQKAIKDFPMINVYLLIKQAQKLLNVKY